MTIPVNENDRSQPTDRPATVLERALLQTRTQMLDERTLLWVLAASEILFINEGEPREGEFPAHPLIVEGGGEPYLAVFSHKDFATRYLVGDRVLVRGPAFEVLRQLPPSAGVVVSVGSDLGFELPASGASTFIRELLGG